MDVRADVVMPLRNGSGMLNSALQSILADPALGKLIIVDDGSNDNWESVVAPTLHAHKDRIVIIRQAACGVAAALNRGLEASTATYVARMDADDISLPGRLKAQAVWMDQFPHIDALGTQVSYVNAEGLVTGHSDHPTDPAALRARLLLRGRCAVSHPSVMLRRKAILDMGGYRRAFEYAEDYDLWLRLAERQRIANLRQAYLLYRHHAAQVSEVHKTRQSFSRDLALLAARERGKGQPDPTDRLPYPYSYAELTSAQLHPVIRKLAAAYDAIDKIQTARNPLSPDAVRAIPDLARASYLGETRKHRYRLIKQAGAAALRRGDVADALQAFYAFARCRTADSRYFRTRHRSAEEA